MVKRLKYSRQADKEFTMASKLERAVAIYRSLGYEETTYENILSLGIGIEGRASYCKGWAEIRRMGANQTIIREQLRLCSRLWM